MSDVTKIAIVFLTFTIALFVFQWLLKKVGGRLERSAKYEYYHAVNDLRCLVSAFDVMFGLLTVISVIFAVIEG